MSAPNTNPRQFHDPSTSDEYEVENVLSCGRLLVRYTTGAWAGKRSTVDPQYRKPSDDGEHEVQ